jgi:hypothetical protein
VARAKTLPFQISIDRAGARENIRKLREGFEGSLADMGASVSQWARRGNTHVAVLTAALENLTRSAQRGYGPLGETLRQFNANLQQTTDFARTATPAFTELELRMAQIRQATEMSGISLMKFSSAMGTSVAQAVVYGNSIGAAMEKALKATLASIAARALVHAIYETAVGFAELFFNPAAAAAAFESAAVFYAVAGAAGAAGAGIPGGRGAGRHASGHRLPGPSSERRGHAMGEYGGEAGGEYSGGGISPAVASGSMGPSLVVNLHIDGRQAATALVPSISDAVRSGSVTLHATTVERGAPVGH